MNEPKRRAARHSLTGTGLYIALFLGLTALAVAGYWMLLPSSTDKTPTNVTEPPVTTPITAEPVTPDVPEVKPEEPAEPVQSVVEVTVLEKEAEVTEPVTPVAPVSAVCAAFAAQPSALPTGSTKTGRCADVRECCRNGKRKRRTSASEFRQREKPQAAKQEKGLTLFCVRPSTSARSAGSFEG